MKFKDKVVVVTGGAKGIGRCITDMFIEEGAHVCVIDIEDNPYFIGDLAIKEDIERFVSKVLGEFKKVDYIINNAKPLFKGIDECSYEEFNLALFVGLSAPFYLVKLLKDHLNEDASIVNISSTRDLMSEPQSESYTAAKGGIQALTHALAASLAGKARVNSIAPGWIETNGIEYHGADNNQHFVQRVGKPEDIANMVLYLCSDKAGFITGQNIYIDGGMTKQMIYHDSYGWKFEE